MPLPSEYIIMRPMACWHPGINGLVQPDRLASPHLLEAKKVMQPVTFRLNGDILTVQNRALQGILSRCLLKGYDFLDLGHLDFTWELTLNGLLVERGVLEINAEAHCEQRLAAPKPSGEVPCRCLPLSSEASGEYHLLVSARTRAGMEVAWEQWHLFTRPAAPPKQPTGLEPKVHSEKSTCSVMAGNLLARTSSGDVLEQIPAIWSHL